MKTAPLGTRLTDCELISLIRQGHRKGAEALYDTYANFLLLAIIRIIPEQKLAQKALQVTLEEIWCSIDEYAVDKSRIYTWMIEIARRAAMEALAKTKKNYENQNEGIYASKR